MSRYVVVAKIHHSVQNGESRRDGSPLWNSFFEERAYTFTGEQPISAIFDRLRGSRSDVIELRLLEDENYRAYTPPEEDPEI